MALNGADTSPYLCCARRQECRRAIRDKPEDANTDDREKSPPSPRANSSPRSPRSPFAVSSPLLQSSRRTRKLCLLAVALPCLGARFLRTISQAGEFPPQYKPTCGQVTTRGRAACRGDVRRN